MRRTDGTFEGRLAAARDGDPGAWSDLYYDIAPILIAYLRAQHLPDPEDVAGEVLLEVVRDLKRFTGDQQRFRSWVLTIAHHRLIDARRRDQRRPSQPLPPEDLLDTVAGDDPEGEVLAANGLELFAPALATLTDDQRTVLLLRVLADLPIADVATIIGKRTGAVKQLQRRAVDAMRRALDEAAPVARHSPTAAGVGATRTTGIPAVACDASPAGGAQR